MSVFKGLASKIIKKKPLVGIEVGYPEIRAVEVAYKEDKPQVARFAQVKAPPGDDNDLIEEALTEALVSMWEKADFNGERAVTALRGGGATEKVIRMPVMPAKELERALEWEAEQLFPFSLAGMSLKHIVLGEEKQGAERQLNVLLAAAPVVLLQKYHRAFESAGLDLIAVDLPVLALWRLFCYLNGKNLTGNIAILNLVFRESRFMVVSEGLPMYIRPLPVAVKEEDLLSGIEKLALEINHSLVYYQNQYQERQIQKIILTGEKSLTEGLTDRLTKQKGLPVELEGNFLLADSALDPQYAIAAGLALWEVG